MMATTAHLAIRPRSKNMHSDSTRPELDSSVKHRILCVDEIFTCSRRSLEVLDRLSATGNAVVEFSCKGEGKRQARLLPRVAPDRDHDLVRSSQETNLLAAYRGGALRLRPSACGIMSS